MNASPLCLNRRFARALLSVFGLLITAFLAAGSANGQTAWSLNPDAPSNVPNFSTGKLKFTNNAFRLVWNTSPTLGKTYHVDLNDAPQLVVPYSLPVSYQSMGVPGSGSARKLTIRYVSSTGEYQAIVPDGQTLTIPNSSHTPVGPARPGSGTLVLSATYGTATASVDVKKVFRTTELPFNNSLGGPGWDFVYGGTGKLLLLSGGSSPKVFYQPGSSSYASSNIGSSSRDSETAVCGAYGNGKLVVGFKDSSYWPDEVESPLVYSSGSSSYSSSSWSEPAFARGFEVRQIAHNNGKFVAVGARFPSTDRDDSKGAVLISSDGVDWTTVVMNDTTYLESVCHDGTRWVVVGNGGAVLTSANGFEWVRTTVPGGETLTSVAAANGYCVVGSAKGKIHTSTDFTSWHLQYSTSGPVSCLAAGEGKFMALVANQVHHSAFSAPGTADIISQPASRFVVPQQSVLLSVGSVGAGPLEYQWYEGVSGNTSLPVPGATESSYLTPPLTGTARYWVRISNAIGHESSSAAVLTMQYPPVITSQPANKRLDVGDYVSSYVVATGNNISYQWYKGYTGDVSTPLTEEVYSNLHIPNEEAGVSYYWVRASNERGSVNSVAMRANVETVFPRIVEEPLDEVIYAGEITSLRVDTEGTSLSYQWYAGMSGDTSQPVPASDSSYIPPRDIPGVYRYWVRVWNTGGSVDSRTVSLTVLESLKPVITRPPLDTVIYTGSTKSLSVTASGSSLSYAWYAGEAGDTSALLHDGSSSFWPSTVVPGSYRYWVRVFNSSGFADSGTVNYLVKPPVAGVISRHPLDATTEKDSSVTLSVTASGAALSYQWYAGLPGDDSNPLSGKTASSFSPPVSAVGQTSYWVRVTLGGTVENSEAAVVKVIPRILVITHPPLDRVTYVGDSFYYYVYTQGSNVTYRWYSGISGDTSNPIEYETSHSFDPPVSTAGTYHYWKRASSGTEHVDSRTATVTVIGRPPYFSHEPEDQLVIQESGSAYLSSSLVNDTGASWQWYRGNSGDTSNPVSGATGSSISIPKSPGGAFTYWVRAINPHGTTDSRSATVTIFGTRYESWVANNGLPADGTGAGAPDAVTNPDGFSNLLRYALGLGASEVPDAERMPRGETWLTLRYVAARDLTDVTVDVEESGGLGDWSASAVECGPSYNNADGTVTRTFRSSVPVDGNPSGFLRLKISPKAAP